MGLFKDILFNFGFNPWDSVRLFLCPNPTFFITEPLKARGPAAINKKDLIKSCSYTGFHGKFYLFLL